LEFTASDDDNFNKLTESVVADEESDFDDWDEEQPGCGDETDTEIEDSFKNQEAPRLLRDKLRIKCAHLTRFTKYLLE